MRSRFPEYIGIENTVGVNSATAALDLALAIADVKGQELITTPMTFVSTHLPILYNNANPVFTETEEDYIESTIQSVLKQSVY